MAVLRGCSAAASTTARRTRTTASKRTTGAKRGGALVTRAGFIGSPTNLIMLASVGSCLAAGRFGLAPSTNMQVLEPGLKLEEVTNDMKTGDPSGFTVRLRGRECSRGERTGTGIVKEKIL